MIDTALTQEEAPARFKGGTPLAVVDIGSNSVRLLVYEDKRRSPAPIFNEKVLCGLGRELASTGRLPDDSVERALAALGRFTAIASLIGATGLNVIATAAARDAENGPQFIARAEEICGTRISVLSGKMEAQLAAHGVISGIDKADGLAGDLGGGSLELINIRDKALKDGITLPLGGLRLLDASDGLLREAETIIERELDKVAFMEDGKGRPLYLVGGTWRNFARLHIVQNDYPLHLVHGYRLKPKKAKKFARFVHGLSESALGSVDGVAKARRPVLPYGAMVLEKLIERIEPSEVVFSAFGVREGLLYGLLDSQEQNKDPLLSACADLSYLRSRSPQHSVELCDWTDQLFQGQDPEETPQEKRLRHAACLLSDTSWRAPSDYRADRSLNQIAYCSLAAIDHPGRAFLALAVYYRHEGIVSEDSSPRLVELVDAGALKRARILGAAIRAIHMLSMGMAGVIGDTPVSLEEGRLVLTIPAAHAALDGERLRNRFGKLAALLGQEPHIRIVS